MKIRQIVQHLFEGGVRDIQEVRRDLAHLIGSVDAAIERGHTHAMVGAAGAEAGDEAAGSVVVTTGHADPKPETPAPSATTAAAETTPAPEAPA